MARDVAPLTPGELLNEELLKPMGITRYRLGKEIGASPRRISEIINGTRDITADTDLRMARFFGLSDGCWLRIQAANSGCNSGKRISEVPEFLSTHPDQPNRVQRTQQLTPIGIR